MTRIQFAQPDQTKIRKIRLAIRVARREFRQAGNVLAGYECGFDQSIGHERQRQNAASKMKRRLGQHRLASQQRFGDPLRELDRPLMVTIAPVAKRNQKTGVRDRSHSREKPLR